MKAQISYQAYGTKGSAVGDTPSEAASNFFEKFPKLRKCSVTEGYKDGSFFTVPYPFPDGHWPKTWKDITKKTAGILT